MSTPHHYMTKALALAHQGLGTVSPNPMVGCLIVNNDHIVGEGYHQRAGEAHAEIHALRQAGTAAKGATVYTTLEPCCHQGKTPPCTEALIKAGIKHLYVACLDPNPLVSGKGVAALRAAGITVEVGLEETAAKQLNETFFHYITHQRPFVIAKWAMSIDGKTVTHKEDNKKISNSASHQHTHQTRKRVDAILVGANTIRQDNPQLTARVENEIVKQPLRIILATQGNLPLDANVFSSDLPGKTLVVVTNEVDQAWYQAAQKKNIEVFIAKNNADGRICLPTLLTELGKREITTLLVEGGMTVLENFFKEKLVNKIDLYLAPTIIGSQDKKQPLYQVSHTLLDGDHYFTAYMNGENHV